MPETAHLHPASHARAVERVCDLADQGAFVTLVGAAGAGRSWVLQQVAHRFGSRAFVGGGLAALSSHPALALMRALRVSLPGDDVALCAEAVLSRTRGGVVIIDDAQFCDPVTLAALPLLAGRVPVVVALRQPHRLSDTVEAALLECSQVVTLGPLEYQEAASIVTAIHPTAHRVDIDRIVKASGGNAVALKALAWRHRTGAAHRVAASDAELTAHRDSDAALEAIAEAIADVDRACRTALVALGLLGRPAHASLLGDAAGRLAEAGWLRASRHGQGFWEPVSWWMAECAAGLAEKTERDDIHRRLGMATKGVESARHLAAAGLDVPARAAALTAAEETTSITDKAEALLIAHRLSDQPDPDLAVQAGRAALEAGRGQQALDAVDGVAGDQAACIRSWAHLSAGRRSQALEAIDQVKGAEAARLRLLANPEASVADHLEDETDPALQCAIAVARARTRPGWEGDISRAAAMAESNADLLTARWALWALTCALIDEERLEEAHTTATAAAAEAKAAGAYSWHTRFISAALWCRALQSHSLDEVIAEGGDLADRALPAHAHGLTTAAVALAEADTGALRSARDRLEAVGGIPTDIAASVAWVACEAAWLDGQPAAFAHIPSTGRSLPGGLAHITAHWAASDAGIFPPQTPDGRWGGAVETTLEAWRKENPQSFCHAAAAWDGLAVREQARSLIAEAMFESDRDRAIACLQQAEALATQAGLAVLCGRIRRLLRQHNVRRDSRSQRSVGDITRREAEVLHLVAAGEPTRRIGQTLGITPETVETHIRSGMRKLGARTRTEAAVLLARRTQ
ncbi:LuxR C-terminal-related transcriptional regulator [Natronoglycomyces albus]|uniref:HTH luxR-type domain-containing protein n=1 Tax=Natronoglycomyces albus TaxID=2811108 RepID=A0A895XTY1_9ACTN|nr:LuxR C-terminal-related transcriptional regulator [Natronoglycomyces albus]QSB06785.1 hypothetical protein JQS30_07825 [Natronoglycomyces albus]